MILLLYTLLILSSYNLINCQKCESKYNIYVSYEDSDKNISQKLVNSCLKPINFDGTNVTGIYVANQYIPNLSPAQIDGLVYLKKIRLYDCGIQYISPGAFKNLPSFYFLDIRYNEITTVLNGTFSGIPTTRTIYFHYNNLIHIEDGAFHIPELQQIYLSNTNLSIWRPEWFGKLDKLKMIIFENNQLTVIPKNAFSDFPNLEILNFDNNNISNIESGAFGSLQTLSVLTVRKNKLKTINPDIFGNKIKIYKFSVKANLLNYLSEELLNKITVNEISVIYNPWVCSCLDRINQWIVSNNIKIFNAENCKLENVPVCLNANYCACPEEIDNDSTQKYFDIMNTVPYYKKQCAGI